MKPCCTSILVVDDEEANRDMMKLIFSTYETEIEFAESGREALENLQTKTPSMVLLDVMMPGMSGLEVCQKIRSDKKLSELNVFIISGKGFEEDVEAGFAAGCNEYFTKPFSIEELLSKINEYVELKEKNA